MVLFIRETLILFDVPLNTFILFPEPSEICHKVSWDWASAEEWITGVMLWSLTGSPPEAKDMDCMWWLAIICGNRKERHSSAVKHFISRQREETVSVCVFVPVWSPVSSGLNCWWRCWDWYSYQQTAGYSCPKYWREVSREAERESETFRLSFLIAS